MGDLPATTPESTALSKELKRRGFGFVGPTTVYAFMQSAGMVDDHLEGCFVADGVRPMTGSGRPGRSTADGVWRCSASAPAAVVSDALDRLGRREQVLDLAIRPLWPEARLAGVAVPVVIVADTSEPELPYDGELTALDGLAPRRRPAVRRRAGRSLRVVGRAVLVRRDRPRRGGGRGRRARP